MRLIRLVLSVLLILITAAHAQTGSAQTPSYLNTEVNALFPNNTLGLISPFDLRQVTLDTIASSCNQSVVTCVTATVLQRNCYIGNGVSNPLSSVSSCNGYNTTGWTLAQWQALLPAAAALTDQVDWAAIQSIINAASGPISISLPPSTAMLNKPLSVCNQSVSFFGSGSRSNNTTGAAGTTLLNFINNTDGVDHCTSSTTVLMMQDISLNSTTLTGTIWGINDQSANYTYLRNVFINGFNYGINFNNPGGTRLLSVFMANGQAGGVDTGSTAVLYTGKGFVNHIQDTLAQGFAISFNFDSTPIVEGLEDIQVLNSACGGTWKCIIIGSTLTTYGPFNYSFINMSVDAAGSFLFAGECNDIVVIGGNWLGDAAVGSWTGGSNMIDLGTATTGCHSVRLRDMWISPGAVTWNSAITAEAVVTDVIMDGLHIETNAATISGSWIQVANGATQVLEHNTQWTNFFAAAAPPSNAIGNFSASPTNKLQSTTLGLPTLSSCGTSPSLSSGSNGEQGTVTMGTASPTGCTLTFPAPNRAVAPSCIVVSRTPGTPVTPTTVSISQIVWTNSGTSSLVVDYKCTPN